MQKLMTAATSQVRARKYKANVEISNLLLTDIEWVSKDYLSLKVN
jgi:hypothetical protein